MRTHEPFLFSTNKLLGVDDFPWGSDGALPLGLEVAHLPVAEVAVYRFREFPPKPRLKPHSACVFAAAVCNLTLSTCNDNESWTARTPLRLFIPVTFAELGRDAVVEISAVRLKHRRAIMPSDPRQSKATSE